MTIHSNNSLTKDDRFITHIENTSHVISFYISIFYLIAGNIGNVLKVLFFLQKPLRSCPCTIYVLFATVTDSVTLNNLPLFRLISGVYPSNQLMYMGFSWIPTMNTTFIESIQPTQENKNMCKIRNYLHMWSTDVSAQLLLFASINRFCVSLKKNRRENRRLSFVFCRLSSALKISLSMLIIWAFVSFHHLFNFNVTLNVCVPERILLWTVWIVSTHCLITVLMIIFGTLTLSNMRRYAAFVRRRSHTHHDLLPISRKSNKQARKTRSSRKRIERQLTAMIIVEAIVTLLTSLPYAGYIIFRLMTSKNSRTPRQMMYENFVELLVRMTMYFEPSCGFYVYLFSLKILQRRFFNVIQLKLRC